jgi:hypothetical protein
LIQIKPIRQELSGEIRHVLDVAVKNLRALETMKLEIDPLSEQVMVKLISNRIDVETRKAYEIQLKADDLPKWNELLQILLQRCHTLESIEKRNFGAPLQVALSTPISLYRQSKKRAELKHLRPPPMLVDHRSNVRCAKKLIILINAPN